ncbi:hypothetical protein ACFU5Y_20870 [Streptomyces gardneri]|uniref:hypothetical protein n=1 Tax=Streptomyces gardneri TaxID=66892 RepID=UPI00367BB4D5
MADERYQWLDQEAAERLLRGEPVDALGDPARTEAGRLAEALESARTPFTAGPGQAELPGEAAALAAFRKASAERAALAAAATAPPAGAARTGHVGHAELGRVRLATATAPTTSARRRWARSVRSVRYGLAAAVAAVAVGGVAVAAGTGVLPLMTPEPANSVTAVESPDPVVTGSHGVRKDPEVPSVGPDGVEPSPGSSSSPGATASHGTPSAPPSPSLSAPPATRHTPEPGRTTLRPGGKGTDGPVAKEKALKACRDFRSGRLDTADRRQLTSDLRGGETLRRYCDRMLSGDQGGSPASAEPREDGKKDGKDDGKDDGKSDGKSDGKKDDGKRGREDDGGHGGTGGDRRDGPDGRSDRGSEDADESRRGTRPAAGVTLSGPSAQY